jgi:hypothetical protein
MSTNTNNLRPLHNPDFSIPARPVVPSVCLQERDSDSNDTGRENNITRRGRFVRQVRRGLGELWENAVLAAILIAALLLGGCASAPSEPQRRSADSLWVRFDTTFVDSLRIPSARR